MLQAIRDSTQGWLTNAVIGLLVIVFAVWGIHGFLELKNESQDKIIANAAGQTLSQRDFDLSYQRLYRQAQIQLGIESPLNKEMVGQLKKQTLEQWTWMQVLAHSARQENYRLTQSAIDSALLNMPIFQSSGRFSSTRFYRVLNAMAYTELLFLTDLKQTLLIDQVQQGLRETAFSLPGERNNAIVLVHQKRDFAYTLLPSSQFLAKQFVSESQALRYYQKNKDRFIQPEQVSIEYIKLSLAAQKNDKIFIEKRDKLANLSYIHPDSLETAAKALGLPIQSTPFFSHSGGNEELTKNTKVIVAAFKQDSLEGNNSSVIDLDAGTAIVFRVKQHSASVVQSFSEVKDQIAEGLKQQMASDKTRLVGEKLLRSLREKGSLSEELNLNWHSMRHAERYDSKPSPAILNAVFNLPRPEKAGKIPLVAGFSLPNGDYVLIKLIAVHEGDSKNLSHSQQIAYSKELEKGFGQLDYDLYVHALTQKGPNHPLPRNSGG